MKKRLQDAMVDNCAMMAAKAKKVRSYVIIYSEINGDVTYHRAGRFAEQLGLIEMIKDVTKQSFTNASVEEDQ